MATWGFDSDVFRGDESGHRLTVTNAVGSGSGVGGFVYKSGAMLFSNTYDTIQTAMEDLARRAREGDWTIQVQQAPDPFGVDSSAHLAELLNKITVRYRLDADDVRAIRKLVEVVGEYRELYEKIIDSKEPQ